MSDLLLNREAYDWAYSKVMEDPDCARVMNKLYEMHNLEHALTRCLSIGEKA